MPPPGGAGRRTGPAGTKRPAPAPDRGWDGRGSASPGACLARGAFGGLL